MIEKVRKYIEQYQMINRGDTIILGISGGADSVCLLFVLLELCEEYELNLMGVHVNHNLRGDEALRDQEFVETICKEHQVPCEVISVDVRREAQKRKRSLEEAGREVRQEAFAEIMENNNLTGNVKIATAHHGNDNAETLLMNLARGTGISGLVGIAPVCDNRIRPLLCVQRTEIELYLREKGQSFCIDHTNLENIYTRNILRNMVIPQLEELVNAQTVVHMNQTMEEMGKIESYLQEDVNRTWESCVQCNSEKTRMILYGEMLEKKNEIIQERVIKRAIEEVAGSRRNIGRVHVAHVLQLFGRQVGRVVHLPYGVEGKRTYEGVEIYQVTNVTENEKSLENIYESGMKLVIPGKTYLSDGSVVKTRILDGNVMDKKQENTYTKYFDYDIMTGVPYIRTRNIGDYIVVNQSGNKQALKKYYINNKVPEELRDRIPLVTLDNEVLWVMGYRRSSRYETNENTNKVLEVKYDGGNHGRIN